MLNNTDSDHDLPSTADRNVKLGFNIAYLIFGVGGNSLVIAVMSSNKNKKSIPRLFVLNLAVSDISFIAATLPINIYSHFKAIRQNLYYCRLLIPLSTAFYFLSIFTIASMAIYRCWLITKPFRPKMRMRSAYIWIIIIWFSSLIIVLPLTVVSQTYNGICYENWPSINHRKAYTISLFILQFVIPLLIIGVAYVRIGIYLWRSTVPQSSLPAQKRRRENIQVIKTLAIIVILFAICLLPGQIAWLLLDFGGKQELQIATVIFKFADILDPLHAGINPIIYGLSNEQFRKECMELFFDCFTCNPKQLKPQRPGQVSTIEASL